MTAPHERAGEQVTIRRGQFWIPGERLATSNGTVQRAPMFVHWEAPIGEVHPTPLVLVHGGGGQGTDWTGTPDGRPGWASHLVEAGFAVYVVDRCGHGRSPYHPDIVAPMGPPFSYEAATELFLPDVARDEQTQWRFARNIGSDPVEQLVCPMGPLPADLAESQRMDTDRLGRLLDMLGRAVLLTHSAGGPVGWLAANARPETVAAIAAIEPLGPPFAEFPGLGSLTWGVTSAAITTDPPAQAPDEVAGRRIPGLEGTPVAVVTGDTSAFAGFAAQVVAFLIAAGSPAQQLHLPEHGITGNGHGLLFEANSDETVRPVLEWIQRIEKGEQS